MKMDRSEVLKAFRDVFEDVMDLEDVEIGESTTANDVEEWDSLSHVRLVVAVERRFGVKFANSEIEGMKCVGDLLDAILSKQG